MEASADKRAKEADESAASTVEQAVSPAGSEEQAPKSAENLISRSSKTRSWWRRR